MSNKRNTGSYTAEQLEAMRARGESLTDWSRVGALSDDELEQAIADDPDEAGAEWDWTRAKLVVPARRQSVHLRLDPEVVAFFKASGPGHITRMQAVLRAYVDAHRHDGGGGSGGRK